MRITLAIALLAFVTAAALPCAAQPYHPKPQKVKKHGRVKHN